LIPAHNSPSEELSHFKPAQEAQMNDPPDPNATEQSPASELSITAYLLTSRNMTLHPGQAERVWMDNTVNRFAYRCMPMLLANQTGWMICCQHDMRMTWDGTPGTNAIKIEVLGGEGMCPALSSFGSGIVTFTIPYLFRTSPGYNLLVQGPANLPKDGISPLSGLVETDWAESTFTMNWMFTRPNHSVTFTKGEPIAMIIPLKRYEAEQFEPVIQLIDANPELKASYEVWANSRRKFNSDLKVKDSEAQKVGWQKHYAQGKTMDGQRTEVHQSKIKLRPFKKV
jgi:antitoxin (DNA-binding transcriptional repressor) of toxin-antitoxin stability system